MRILLAVFGVFLGATALVFGLQLNHVNGEVGQLQQQAAQAQARARSLEAQVLAAETVVSDAREQLVSGHKDVITCGDVQDGLVSVSGTDAYGNLLTMSGSMALPQHCINR